MGFMFGEHAGLMGQALIDLGYRDLNTKKPTTKAREEKLVQDGLTKAFVWDVEKVQEVLKNNEAFSTWAILPEDHRSGVQCAKRIMSTVNNRNLNEFTKVTTKNALKIFKSYIGQVQTFEEAMTARVVFDYLEKSNFHQKNKSIYYNLKRMAPDHVIDQHLLDQATPTVRQNMKRPRL